MKKEPRLAIRMSDRLKAELRKVAEQNNQTLSAYVRDAALLHKAGMAGGELNLHLLEMRRALNAALLLRTPEQKNVRIERVRDRLTAMLHRANNIGSGNLPEV